MIRRIHALWRNYRTAASVSGRSALALAWEASQLQRCEGRLSPSEYLDFSLPASRLSLAEKRCFVGYRGQYVIDELTTDEYSKIVSLDKLTFDALMRGHDLPVPELLGTYDPSGRRRSRNLPIAQDAASLRKLLQQLGGRSIYLKAAYGGYGRSNLAIDAYDPVSDEIVLRDTRRLTTEQLAARLDQDAVMSVLIQEALEPHPAIAAVCGPRLSGLRLQVLLRPGGPQIFRCTWKITTGLNVVDNFQHGNSGNMLGAVDVESGSVTRVVAGIGSAQRVNPRHPDTGANLLGFRIPDWDRVTELVERASQTLPGLLVQGWDVALTPRGPVLMEVNCVGDVDLPQHAYGRGWLDEEFREFLRERGVEGLLKGRMRDSLQLNPNGRRGRRKRHWKY